MKQRIAELVTVLITGVFCTFLVAATNFPTNLDTYTDKTSSDVITAAGWNNMQDAIEACEAKIGKDSSAVTTSHDYKLGALTTSLGVIQTTMGETSYDDFVKLHALTGTSTEINLLDADNRTVGDIITETAAGTMGPIAAVAVGQYLKSAGVATSPAYGKLALSDTGVKMGSVNLTTAIASYDITGIGYSPSVIILIAGETNTGDAFSWGFDDGDASHKSIARYDDGTTSLGTSVSYNLYESSSRYMNGHVSAKSSDGFTLAHDQVSSSVCTGYLIYLTLP